MECTANRDLETTPLLGTLAPAVKKKKSKKRRKQNKEHSVADAERKLSDNDPRRIAHDLKAVPIAPQSRPSLSTSIPGSKIRWNFEVEYNDHFETPQMAYGDISSILEYLAEDIGKPKSELVVYDPYFCQGQMVRHMHELGFENVINLNRDFYQDILNKAIPGKFQVKHHHKSLFI